MAVKTRQQARAQAGDSDPPEESRELPPVSTRPSLNKKRAAPKPLQKSTSEEGHNLLLDLPPELRIVIYEYCIAAKDPFGMMENRIMDIKKSSMPALLSVNRQTREEVLPIFYKSNEFSFGSCDAKYITRWLFRAVKPKHLNLISAISWTSGHQTTWSGPRSIGSRSIGTDTDVLKLYIKAAQESAIHLSSVIMLLELGILGSCKVKMSLHNEPRLHVACALHQSTKKAIARKNLTEDDTWNEDNVPGEDDVAGLAYVVAKEWARRAPQAFQDSTLAPPLAPEIYCLSCKTVSTSRDLGEQGMISRLPWVSRSEATEITSGHSGVASSTEAEQ
jgi:hypothetical protein